MIHEPDCPLFNQTIEGEGRKKKKTLIRVIADQLPRTRKQFENEKNALNNATPLATLSPNPDNKPVSTDDNI